MKYVDNSGMHGRGGTPLLLTVVEGDDAEPVTPTMLLKFAANSYEGKNVGDYKVIVELLDSLEEQEKSGAKVLEIENEWWNKVKNHLDEFIAGMWKAHSPSIWAELEARMEVERKKHDAEDSSKSAKGKS
jgi:hypothetical protein